MTKLRDVNTTDISDAIQLGCRCMCNCFNADDDDIPYFGANVRPEARLRGSSESHTPGRYLNALLNAEDALDIEIEEDAVDKHAKAAFFSYSRLPLSLHRVSEHTGGEGTPTELRDHNLREGFHALYALAQYRDSERARELAKASIQVIIDYWGPNEEWDFERDLPVQIAPGSQNTFIQRLARAMGPLVKLYRATGHEPALELAVVLKNKALREYFQEDGGGSTEIFGRHAHSTTCVLSSLAQLAALTQDESLMGRVKAFYDNGLEQMRDQIGWSIEVTDSEPGGRGEANNTGNNPSGPDSGPLGLFRLLRRCRADPAQPSLTVPAARRLLCRRTRQSRQGGWPQERS